MQKLHTCHNCGIETLSGGHGPCVACNAFPANWTDDDHQAYLFSAQGVL